MRHTECRRASDPFAYQRIDRRPGEALRTVLKMQKGLVKIQLDTKKQQDTAILGSFNSDQRRRPFSDAAQCV
jgi:hypothetical protein